MKINIFEGARRVSLLVGACWVLGCIVYAVTNRPEPKSWEILPIVKQEVPTQNSYPSMSDEELMTAYQKAKNSKRVPDWDLPDDLKEKANSSEQHWKNVSATLFAGLAVGWALVAAIGWIVRGFMGIPRSKDARPAP